MPTIFEEFMESKSWRQPETAPTRCHLKSLFGVLGFGGLGGGLGVRGLGFGGLGFRGLGGLGV